MRNRARLGRDRLAIAKEAGHGRVSPLSVVAGLLTAYGAFAILAALVAAVIAVTNVEVDFRTNDWVGSGAIGGLVTAAVLFAAYLFGGYVAGRMARRSGYLQGMFVFLLTVATAVVVGWVAWGVEDSSITDNFRSIGVPTSQDQLTGVAIASASASVAAVLVGAMLGGALGERWHTKLAQRAADPNYGPALDLRDRADHVDAERTPLIERDEAIRRQVEPADLGEDEAREVGRRAFLREGAGVDEIDARPVHRASADGRETT